jgi:hypothetical protein
MSTMGRSADRAAEQERRWRSRLEQKKIRLSHELNFVINTLADESTTDSVARALCLKVLLGWRL